MLATWNETLYTPLHISHNAPYLLPPLTPQILHNLWLSFPPGITAVPREFENNAYTNFLGVNKVIMGNVEVAYGRSYNPGQKSLGQY